MDKLAGQEETSTGPGEEEDNTATTEPIKSKAPTGEPVEKEVPEVSGQPPSSQET